MDRPWGCHWDWLLLVCPCHSQFCFMGRDCTTQMRMQNAPYHHLYDFAECLVLNLPHSERNSINYMYHSFYYLVVLSTILSLLFYFCPLRSRNRLILLIVFLSLLLVMLMIIKVNPTTVLYCIVLYCIVSSMPTLVRSVLKLV